VKTFHGTNKHQKNVHVGSKEALRSPERSKLQHSKGTSLNNSVLIPKTVKKNKYEGNLPEISERQPFGKAQSKKAGKEEVQDLNVILLESLNKLKVGRVFTV